MYSYLIVRIQKHYASIVIDCEKTKSNVENNLIL